MQPIQQQQEQVQPLVANIEPLPPPINIGDNIVPHIVPTVNTTNNHPLHTFINNNNNSNNNNEEEAFDDNLEINISPYTGRFYRRTDNPVYQQGIIGNTNHTSTTTTSNHNVLSNHDRYDLNTIPTDMSIHEDHYDFDWNEIENRDINNDTYSNNDSNLNNDTVNNDNSNVINIAAIGEDNHNNEEFNNNQNENIVIENNVLANNNANNNEPQAQQEEGDIEEEEIEGDNVQENGIEIRVALFDLLGIEGPIYIMFRNSFWLLGFCSLYLCSLAALPYIIGYKVVQVFKIHILMKYISIFPVFQFLNDVYDVANKNKIPLQFIDFIYMGTGMSAVFLIVFFLNLIAKAALSFKLIGGSMFSNYLELLKKLSVVVKVGLLLVIRIFVLPLVLGNSLYI